MLKPRNTLVTVAPVEKKEATQVGGIIVPDETSKFYEQCEVIDVGPGMLTHKDETSPCADLKPGQRVLVHNYARTPEQKLQPIGVSFKTEDRRDLILVEQSQIVAVVAEPQDDDGVKANRRPSDKDMESDDHFQRGSGGPGFRLTD